MGYKVALYKNVKWEYEFVAECERYDNCIENIMISEPVEVEFTLNPKTDDSVLHAMKVAIAQKVVDEAQVKLEKVANEC